MFLNPIMLERYSHNYAEFLAITSETGLELAGKWCEQIWNYIQWAGIPQLSPRPLVSVSKEANRIRSSRKLAA